MKDLVGEIRTEKLIGRGGNINEYKEEGEERQYICKKLSFTWEEYRVEQVKKEEERTNKEGVSRENQRQALRAPRVDRSDRVMELRTDEDIEVFEEALK